MKFLIEAAIVFAQEIFRNFCQIVARFNVKKDGRRWIDRILTY